MTKITRFQDIPKFPQAYYSITVSIAYLKDTLASWSTRENELILNPEWQRGHIWTEQQQIAFMEYFLKNGTTGRDIFFNCSTWQKGYSTPIYLLDGLQRITAALAFLDNKIPIFGTYYSEFTDRIRMSEGKFNFHMLCLSSKKDLLKVYIDHNSGGTPHNAEEIARIQQMMDETKEDETL
jgi:hypothetical protein